MNFRRRMLLNLATKENLIKKATYFSGVVMVTANKSTTKCSGSDLNNGIFSVSVIPNKTYNIKKRENLGDVFKIGFCDTEPKVNGTVYNFVAVENSEKVTLIAPDNCNYLFIQAHSGSANGDIHEAVSEILIVNEV